ncbi:MAG: hypothetical protein ABIR37_01090 [Candidatus Saccharimonadales bacterium]
MNGPEKARRRLLNPRHRGRALIGSPGLNNETSNPADISTEQTTGGKEQELRLTDAAKEAGQHSVAHTIAPPVQQGSEEFHG